MLLILQHYLLIVQSKGMDTHNYNNMKVYEVPGVAAIGFPYHKPSYCYNCGYPFPWTEQLINNAVELIALDEELTDEQKEILKNALPDLIVETPSTPVATAK